MNRKGLILAYHRVNSTGKDPLAVSVENFREQMGHFYQMGYTSLTLEEYAQKLIHNDVPKKALIITFDDGYRDNYLFAFPVLKVFGFRGTIFLTTDYIGKNEVFHMDGEKNWKEILDEDLPLTWEQVFQMKAYGIEFGSHTCTHRHLDKLPEAEVLKEVSLSKRCLEEKLQTVVTSFCYPSGRFNQLVKEAVRREGYLAAVVTPRRDQVSEDFYTLKRIGIYPKDAGWRFRLKISYPFSKFRDLGLLYRFKKTIGGEAVQS